MHYPKYEPKMPGNALYTVDAIDGHDESWTLDQIVKANDPGTFAEEDLEAIRGLDQGQSLTFGGGAAAEWVIRRVK